MRKKIISLFVILILSLNLVSQSAYANSDGEILTPISSEETLTPSAVINPGSAAVGVTLKTNQFVAVSDSIKIIDGTGNVYMQAENGAVTVGIYYVYAGGPDKLLKEYVVLPGKTLNTTIKDMVPATYVIKVYRGNPDITNTSAFGYLAD